MKSLSLAKPHLLVLAGIPSSGKTFFAEKFAATFRAPLVSREKIAIRLSYDGEQVDLIATDQLDELLKTSQSIVVDGMADSRAERADIMKKARAAGYDTLLIWVQTEPATARNRAARSGADETHRVLRGQEYDRALQRFNPPLAIEKPVVISGKHTYATQAKVVLKKLSAPRANLPIQGGAPVRTAESGRRNIIIR